MISIVILIFIVNITLIYYLILCVSIEDMRIIEINGISSMYANLKQMNIVLSDP